MEPSKDALITDLLTSWRISERTNQYMIDHLDDAAWSAKPPGGKGRSIAAIFAHIHGVRLMWVKSADKSVTLEAKPESREPEKRVIKKLLAESAGAVERIVAQGLQIGKVAGFPPSAAAFLTYMVAHEAHHRGQAAMLARQVGHPLPASAGFGLWEWNSRFKEISET